MRRTKAVKANSDQITYVQVGTREDGAPNFPFAFSVRAGKVAIFQTRPTEYQIEVIEAK